MGVFACEREYPLVDHGGCTDPVGVMPSSLAETWLWGVTLPLGQCVAMAFVARTTRDSNPIGNPFKQNEAYPHIGPGSYDVRTSFKAAQPSYAPFKSSTTRDGPTPSGNAYLPGPGQYQSIDVPKVGARKTMETPFLAYANRFEKASSSDLLVYGTLRLE